MKKRYSLLPVFAVLVAFTTLAYAAGKSISKSDLARLYGYWFSGTYEYMFYPVAEQVAEGGRSSKDITVVNGKGYGTYMGGPKGILFYGSLTEAAAKYLGKSAGGWGDVRILGSLSGISPVLKEEEFKYINPDIVKWGIENLVPRPDDRVAGHSCRDLYRIFKRFARLTTESYLYIQNNMNYAKEQSTYTDAIRGGGNQFYGQNYLEEKYKGILQEYFFGEGFGVYQPHTAIGFWLRRGMDGTHAALWKGLKDVMMTYDRQWFLSLKGKYRKMP